MTDICSTSTVQWVEGKGNKTFETHCPANGEFLSVCVDAGLEDVDDAVQAAGKPWPAWKEVSPGERSAMLWKIADLIDEKRGRTGLDRNHGTTGSPIPGKLPAWMFP